MATIVEILGATNYGKYAVVDVLLDNQEEASVYVGGDCEVFYDTKHGKYKAVIKRRKSHTNEVNKGINVAHATDDERTNLDND